MLRQFSRTNDTPLASSATSAGFDTRRWMKGCGVDPISAKNNKISLRR